MTPPIPQVSLLESVNTGKPKILFTIDPGVHVPTGAIAHGVGTPDAEAVSVWQVPNGGRFAPVAQS